MSDQTSSGSADAPPALIVVMGVSGCGKSHVGAALAARFGLDFIEGDALHPAENVEKMRAGTPLTDADRWPWLAEIGAAMRAAAGRGPGAVGACSALKRAYREALTAAAGAPILFVYLEGSRDLLAARLAGRSHAFMPPALLDSQFAALEPPAADEWAVAVPIDGTKAATVARAIAAAGAALRQVRA